MPRIDLSERSASANKCGPEPLITKEQDFMFRQTLVQRIDLGIAHPSTQIDAFKSAPSADKGTQCTRYWQIVQSHHTHRS